MQEQNYQGYDHSIVENEILKRWEENFYKEKSSQQSKATIKASEVKSKEDLEKLLKEINREKPTFSMVIPPPNVTGSLHIGHALNITVQDLIARYKRMKGFDVVWVPGFDHAGIATQFVVERNLSKEGISRLSLGRELFLKRVWQWVKISKEKIKSQIIRVGASVSWTKERFTLDEGFSRAVRKAFKKLYDQGLIYKGSYLVNWCPKDLTALSDLEVEYEQENGKIYYIKYPLEDGGFITVATTRPETMLGDTAIAVNPEDERYKDLIGKFAILPLSKEQRKDLNGNTIANRIPIIEDKRVEKEFGTGAVKITPAHDFLDYEIGLSHNLPIINIFNEDATLNENAGEFAGLDRFEARKKIVEKLKELELLEKEETYVHNVGKCYRCKTTVEPLISYQWFLKLSDKKDIFLEPVKKGDIKFNPEGWSKAYIDWISNLKDWCISRQIWWGHRFPVWECKDCGSVNVFDDDDFEMAYDKLIFNLYADEKIGLTFKPEEISNILKESHFVQNRLSVLDFYKHFVFKKYYAMGSDEFLIWKHLVDQRDLYKYNKEQKTFTFLPRCKSCGSTNLERDKNVLDTWFSSGLWPFGVFSWPEKSKDLEKYYPNSLLVTAFDIIFFWVARMIIMGELLTENIPFKELFIHGLIRDEKGQKMSKTKGNVIDPLDIIEKYGADSLRFTLISTLSGNKDIKLSEKKFESSKHFVNKIWNAFRFIKINTPEDYISDSIYGTHYTKEDLWIITLVNLLAKQVSEYIESYQFNMAANLIYSFFWNEFCDWYIEFTKVRIYKKEKEIKEDDPNKEDIIRENTVIKEQKLTALNVLYMVLSKALKVLYPFMPFVSTYIYQNLPNTSVPLEEELYPEFNESELFFQELSEIEKLKEIISFIRRIRSDLKIEANKRIELFYISKNEILKEFKEHILELSKLSSLEEIEFPIVNSLEFAINDIRFFVKAEGNIDKEKLLKDYEKELSSLSKELNIVNSKLSNENFLKKAPSEELEKTKEQKEALTLKIDNINYIISQLKNL